ncbi:hypothetical protein VTN31DRAFT_2529 [Thermomyces dupontii]|uniref:uncharacterized protein n=1 Tax=Talaromyces thermophilus TaxID=28565 RepID=UPI0037441B50
MLAAVLNRKFLFALTILALLCAKFLHLFSHLFSISLPLFVLYFPTFVTPDVLVIFFTRLIFQYSLTATILLCVPIIFGAAAQVALFLETGGEIRWSMLGKILAKPQGFIRMLLTGLMSTSVVITVLSVAAYLLTPSLYNWTGQVLETWAALLPYRRLRLRCKRADHYQLVADQPEDDEEDVTETRKPTGNILWKRIKFVTVVGIVSVLHIVRPAQPYRHMSGTLPFTMLEAIFQRRSPLCDPSPADGPKQFPLRKLVDRANWLAPTNTSRGWQPGLLWWEVTRDRPSWLPRESLPGFEKWYRGSSYLLLPDLRPGEAPHDYVDDNDHHHSDDAKFEHMPPGYDSVLDPLKIYNSEESLVEELRSALSDSAGPEIKHVIIMSLESTRKDVFPLIKDSSLYDNMMNSWKNANRETSRRGDPSTLSVNAERVTGQDGGFGRDFNFTRGGINVVGAVTSSTFTLKSLLSSHCGVNPLPVDFLEEIEAEIYQPCLPQIMKLMNAQNHTGSSWNTLPWKTVFMQAATSAMDRQDQLMEAMGFDEVIDREVLQSPDAEFPPEGPELNYFGYSERILKPYIRKALLDAEEQGQRLLLSHLTTSTHHPWATPDEFGPQMDYFGGKLGGDKPFNRYLNTIKFADEWVGDVLHLLEELDLAERTLLILLGDHGASFVGDGVSSMTGTYANTHIVTFQIPLVFYHPRLPRIQLEARVSPLSVVPTVLDLLQATNSLDEPSSSVARDLIPEYEGQSLIRNLVHQRDGRQVWHFGVINPGGTHLSIMSAAYPSYRYVMPICESSPYSFTHLEQDPSEETPVQGWNGGESLARQVRQRYGEEAAQWVQEAEEIGKWYVWEARRRWGYWSGSRMEDRGAEHREDGVFRHKHWWIP